jgi:hypothetical protein
MNRECDQVEIRRRNADALHQTIGQNRKLPAPVWQAANDALIGRRQEK